MLSAVIWVSHNVMLLRFRRSQSSINVQLIFVRRGLRFTSGHVSYVPASLKLQLRSTRVKKRSLPEPARYNLSCVHSPWVTHKEHWTATFVQGLIELLKTAEIIVLGDRLFKSSLTVLQSWSSANPCHFWLIWYGMGRHWIVNERKHAYDDSISPVSMIVWSDLELEDIYFWPSQLRQQHPCACESSSRSPLRISLHEIVTALIPNIDSYSCRTAVVQYFVFGCQLQLLFPVFLLCCSLLYSFQLRCVL